MSTHNIGFYEEINKIIFQLSFDLNYIKYTLYLLFCYFSMYIEVTKIILQLLYSYLMPVW